MSRAHPIAGTVDQLLLPVHRWIWSHPARRTQKLLRFSETEIDGGRDILRAAEVTGDPLLRRLYMLHAVDEHRHGVSVPPSCSVAASRLVVRRRCTGWLG